MAGCRVIVVLAAIIVASLAVSTHGDREEREPGPPYGKRPRPPQRRKPNYAPVVQPAPQATASLAALQITPSIAVIHGCWKSYPTLADIQQSVENGITVTGLTVQDIKDATVLHASVTATDNYKANTLVIWVAELQVLLKKLYSNTVQSLAQSIASLIHGRIRRTVKDVLCVNIVLELKIIRSKQVYEEPTYDDDDDYPSIYGKSGPLEPNGSPQIPPVLDPVPVQVPGPVQNTETQISALS